MLARHSVYYFLSKVFPGIVEIIAIALYTRLLGENEYGIYVLVLGVVLLLDVSLFGWMRLSLVRYWPRYSEKELLSSLVVLYSIIVGFTMICSIAAAMFWQNTYALQIILSALLLLWTKSWFELHLESVRSRLEPRNYGSLSIVRSAFSILCGGVLAYLGYGAVGILIGMAIGNLLSFLLLGLKQWKGISFRLSDNFQLKQFLSYGLPFTLSLSIGFFVNSVDRYMIAFIESVESSGLYAAGYDLPGKVVSMLYVSMSLAAAPLVIRAYEGEGAERAVEMLKKYFTLICSIVIPSCIGIVILSENIATVFLGEEFRNAAIDIIPWITIGILIGGFKSYYVDLCFQIAQKTHIQVWIAIFTLTVNVGLNLWWIPLYGIIGAAYSTLVTFLLSMSASWAMGRSFFKLPFLGGTLIKITIASVLMGGALWPLVHLRGELMLLVQLIVGGIVYGACYLFLNISDSKALLGGLNYFNHRRKK